MRRLVLVVTGAMALGALAICVGGAAAASTSCTSRIHGVMEIKGDVNAGPGCDLSEVTSVTGNVKVQKGGSLTIEFGSGISIRGDIQASKADFVDVEGGSIGHDVRIEGTTGFVTLGFGSVGHDVDVQKGNASVRVVNESVGGNVRIHENKGAGDGSFGNIEVQASTIQGDLVVEKNTLNGSDINLLDVFNGVAGPGSIGDDLRVNDNTVSGGPGSINLVRVFSNLVGHNTDVHGNNAQGGDDNEILTFDNDVTSDLTVHDNEAKGNGANVDVSDNTIGHDLDCHGNKPHASNGGGQNNANGHKKGECKDF